MDVTDNGKFTPAFLQGLAVVLFLYVVIFTTTIFLGGKTESKLASQDITITTEEGPAPQPGSGLTPQDMVPVPTTPEQQAVQPAPTTTTTTLAPVPGVIADNKDLLETTPMGQMPKKSSSGLSPFDAYKKPFVYKNKPVIALAVLDYGLSESDSRDALKTLPGEVSLILNPYAQNYDAWKSLAVGAGHEFWISLPMENQSYPAVSDPGPQALLAHSDFKYNQEKFLWVMTRTTGYAGIAGYSDTAFLNAQSALKVLWDEAFNRGVGYFEINPAGLEGIEMNAVEKKGAYIRSQAVFNESNQNIDNWLKSLELEASNTGYAVGVLKPYPQVVAAVSDWASKLEDRGFSLAPVSALAQLNSDNKPTGTGAPTEPAPVVAVPPKAPDNAKP